MSDETNTYGEDIHLTTIDSSTNYTELITALEKGAGEPLYPGDEQKIVCSMIYVCYGQIVYMFQIIVDIHGCAIMIH